MTFLAQEKHLGRTLLPRRSGVVKVCRLERGFSWFAINALMDFTEHVDRKAQSGMC